MTKMLSCRELNLELGERTIIMGILNITPDSFSDGGEYLAADAAITRAKQMIHEGADIIDIGGESTRPGFIKVSVQEELGRVIPIIEALKQELNIPISIDTYKSEVARQALQAGAHIVNDVWGGKAEPQILEVAAKYDCPIVLTHNRTDMKYRNFLQDVLADLQESIEFSLRAGIRPEQIILDPGIGFAKTLEHNLWLMNHLQALSELGYPVLLGTSRKSMIRSVLELPADDVIEGTAATVAHGIAQGCDIIRVHDIQAMKRVAVMTDAMVKSRL
jgi:dihydropteroate synthase